MEVIQGFFQGGIDKLQADHKATDQEDGDPFQAIKGKPPAGAHDKNQSGKVHFHMSFGTPCLDDTRPGAGQSIPE